MSCITTLDNSVNQIISQNSVDKDYSASNQATLESSSIRTYTPQEASSLMRFSNLPKVKHIIDNNPDNFFYGLIEHLTGPLKEVYSIIQRNLSAEKNLVKLCSSLYNIEPSEIESIERDDDFHYVNRCWRFNATLNSGDKKTFYVKENWEQKPVVEGLGMTLTNLLWKEVFNFSIPKSRRNHAIVMDEIQGKTISEYHEEFSPKLSINYGVAIEIANALGLGDRHGRNTIISDEECTNIDFGALFKIRGFSIQTLGQHNRTNPKLVNMGQEEGKEMIVQKYKEQKELIEELVKITQKRVKFSLDPIAHLEKYTTTPVVYC